MKLYKEQDAEKVADEYGIYTNMELVEAEKRTSQDAEYLFSAFGKRKSETRKNSIAGNDASAHSDNSVE